MAYYNENPRGGPSTPPHLYHRGGVSFLVDLRVKIGESALFNLEKPEPLFFPKMANNMEVLES